MRSSSAGLDLSATIKLVKVDFSGNQNDASSEMQNFCKTFSKEFAAANSSTTFKNSIVVDALQSFNECRQLETQGVRFVQSIQEPSQLSVTAFFNPDTTVLTVKQLNQSNFVCKTSAASKDGLIKPVSSITKEFKPAKSFTVSCDRKGSIKPSGTQYDRASIRIDTNWGPYSVMMQPEGLLNFDLASQAKAQNEEVLKQNQQLSLSLGNEKSRADSFESKWNAVSTDVYGVMVGEGAELPCGSSVSNWAFAKCGGRPMKGPILTSSRGGNACGYTGFAVACLNK